MFLEKFRDCDFLGPLGFGTMVIGRLRCNHRRDAKIMAGLLIINIYI